MVCMVMIDILGRAKLITYQSDVSYDGRVSMKDLAYLNAGAAAGYSEDVTLTMTEL